MEYVINSGVLMLIQEIGKLKLRQIIGAEAEAEVNVHELNPGFDNIETGLIK